VKYKTDGKRQSSLIKKDWLKRYLCNEKFYKHSNIGFQIFDNGN